MKDSTAIATWSLLPLILACKFVQSEGWLALIFASIAVIGLAAAFLSRSSRATHKALAVALLLLISAPFAIDLIDGIAKGGRNPLVADSPSGFVLGTVAYSLFSVPPIVLALGVWRRRGAVVKLPPHA